MHHVQSAEKKSVFVAISGCLLLVCTGCSSAVEGFELLWVKDESPAIPEGGSNDSIDDGSDAGAPFQPNGSEKYADGLTVAAVQMAAKNNDICGNLKNAQPYVQEAAEKGAQLVLLPEFLATGYIFTEAIWDSGEPTDGCTVQWLRQQAIANEVWLGTTFLEAQGEHFYNTFVLMDPAGTEAGRVQKRVPAAWEAYFNAGGDKSDLHTIKTPLGAIGVGICYENYHCFFKNLMHVQAVDLILMPHSAPLPREQIPTLGYMPTAQWYAEELRVPVVMANKAGEFYTPLPDKKHFGPPSEYEGQFGGSHIADRTGKLVVQDLAIDFEGSGMVPYDVQGVLLAQVQLGAARKTAQRPPCFTRYIPQTYPLAAAYGPVFDAVEKSGSASYANSQKRREKALAISATSGCDCTF